MFLWFTRRIPRWRGVRLVITHQSEIAIYYNYPNIIILQHIKRVWQQKVVAKETFSQLGLPAFNIEPVR